MGTTFCQEETLSGPDAPQQEQQEGQEEDPIPTFGVDTAASEPVESSQEEARRKLERFEMGGAGHDPAVHKVFDTPENSTKSAGRQWRKGTIQMQQYLKHNKKKDQSAHGAISEEQGSALSPELQKRAKAFTGGMSLQYVVQVRPAVQNSTN